MADAEQKAPETEESDLVQNGNERILLVDDEQQVLRMENLLLERLGYHVTPQSNSLEALETFRTDPTRFDMVITDMTMPHLTGDQLSRELLRIRPGIPIFICTGYSERISKEKAQAMGISGFIFKPVEKNVLSHKIRAVLDK
jgi:CheY-like chemotaxis protein